tara:strand:+ start:902 stop:1987 length:1086 start_codon:yes stop_codon:yes gene_type:complete
MKDFIDRCIDNVAALQCFGNSHFSDGLFPSYRENIRLGYRREDATVFFSSIICFSLQEIAINCSFETRNKIAVVHQKVVRNYPEYQNKDGLATYNFWKTKPSQHFPNGYLFKNSLHFKIPDDIDDTAFVYLNTFKNKEEDLWLKRKLQQHANNSNQQIKNTFEDCKSLKAYSTWFGDKMYIEFDACALSNILYWVFSKGLELSDNDKDSLYYIKRIIETDRYLTVPFYCAHHYPRTSLIIYHVSRLISKFDPVILKPIKEKLIFDSELLLKETSIPMEQVLLSIALLRLGKRPQYVAVENFTNREFKGFYFFIAGLLTAYENKILYKIAPHPVFHMNWYCEAHCWVLLAEYQNLYLNFKIT